MINVLFCCGGGFSSSTMVEYINKGVKEYGLDNEITFTFCPFQLSSKKFQDYDIMVCCPHLERQIKEHNERYIKNAIPMYVLPPRMYGPVDAKELYTDIVDVLDMFKKNPQNPVSFPGEEHILKVRRINAYRNTVKA
jgi:PTS system cellobiose-specific IIB component